MTTTNVVILDTNRSTNDIKTAMRRSITVKDLIETLEGYDPDAQIVFSNDGGYTFGEINYESIDEKEVRMRPLVVTNIIWDINPEVFYSTEEYEKAKENLPREETIPDVVYVDDIEEYLEECYGYKVKSYTI